MAQLLPRTSAKTIHSRVGGCHRTALHLAAADGHDRVVSQLLVVSPDLIRAADFYGRTALHLAAIYGHDKVVAQLLAASPSVSVQTDFDGRIPLHDASSVAVVDELLAVNPGSIGAVDPRMNTVLHWAARDMTAIDRNDDSVVKRLLEIKPELIFDVNNVGNTPLHMAINNQSYFKTDRMGPAVEEIMETEPRCRACGQHIWQYPLSLCCPQ